MDFVEYPKALYNAKHQVKEVADAEEEAKWRAKGYGAHPDSEVEGDVAQTACDPLPSPAEASARASRKKPAAKKKAARKSPPPAAVK